LAIFAAIRRAASISRTRGFAWFVWHWFCLGWRPGPQGIY
jgi:hypothetical protein